MSNKSFVQYEETCFVQIMKLSVNHTKYLVGFANCIHTLSWDFQITGYGNSTVGDNGIITMANMHHYTFLWIELLQLFGWPTTEIIQILLQFINIVTTYCFSQNFVSSMNILICVVIQFGRSLTNVRNSGPSTEPCGMPLHTWDQHSPLTITLINLLCRKYFIHSRRSPVILL